LTGQYYKINELHSRSAGSVAEIQIIGKIKTSKRLNLARIKKKDYCYFVDDTGQMELVSGSQVD
jgi:hypothetical protein